MPDWYADVSFPDSCQHLSPKQDLCLQLGSLPHNQFEILPTWQLNTTFTRPVPSAVQRNCWLSHDRLPGGLVAPRNRVKNFIDALHGPTRADFQAFYQLEYMKLADCSRETMTYMQYDPRYTPLDFVTNELTV
jgi:hypothetical protein